MKSSFDTSFLVSLYVPDANSAAAIATVQALRSSIDMNPILHLEVMNAIQLRVFRSEITRPQAKRVLASIESDVRSGFLTLTAAPTALYEMANRLSVRHSARLGVRSLDILHVAIAVLNQASRFYTFDGRQAKLARACNLAIPVP